MVQKNRSYYIIPFILFLLISCDNSKSLLKASLKGDTDKVRSILQKEGVDLNTRANNQATPLLFASSAGHAEIVKLLLDKGADIAYAQTLGFLTLVFGQMFHIFDARTFTTLYRVNPFGNRTLLLSLGVSATLSLLMVYTNIGHLALGTASITFKHLVMVIFIAALPTLVLSGIKEIFKIKWI